MTSVEINSAKRLVVDNVQRPRGASAVLGNTDATGRLERVGSDGSGVKSMEVIYHPGKMKDAPQPPTLGFTAKQIQVGVDESGEPMTSLVLIANAGVVENQECRAEARERTVLREIARNPAQAQKYYVEATKIPRTTLRNIVKALIARGFVVKNSGNKWLPTPEGIDYLEEWAEHDEAISEIVGPHVWNAQPFQSVHSGGLG